MRQRNPISWLLLAALLAVGWWLWSKPAPQAVPAPAAASGAASPRMPDPEPLAGIETRARGAAPAALPGFLPAEASDTIRLVLRGGPFPHRQDGSVFGNREGHLPRQPRGWYREYTVDTPGLSHRGARRIVTGGDPPREWYYTGDHYESFRRFDVPEDMR
jgi:guanyl-specific ribonuclease Sa